MCRILLKPVYPTYYQISRSPVRLSKHPEMLWSSSVIKSGVTLSTRTERDRQALPDIIWYTYTLRGLFEHWRSERKARTISRIIFSIRSTLSKLAAGYSSWDPGSGRVGRLISWTLISIVAVGWLGARRENMSKATVPASTWIGLGVSADLATEYCLW